MNRNRTGHYPVTLSGEKRTQQQTLTCARLRPDAINTCYLSNYSLSFLPIFENWAQTAGAGFQTSSWLRLLILQKWIFCHLPAQLSSTVPFSPLLLTQTSNLITALLLSCFVISHFILHIKSTMILTCIHMHTHNNKNMELIVCDWSICEGKPHLFPPSPHQFISMVTTSRLVFTELTRAVLLHKSPACQITSNQLQACSMNMLKKR